MSLTLKDYINGLRGKRVAVVGVGVSNTPLLRLLLAAGISVTACDQRTRQEFGALADELEALGAALSLGEDYLEGLDQDVIFRAPGIRPDIPAFQAACARGSILTSEMEVFLEVCPARIIAVTGSDGKTTTTTLIAEMLKAAGHTVYLGGNIGTPLLDQAEQMGGDDFAVLELSSFQLMTIRRSPGICVMTNLSPNHLDWHTSLEEYRDAKENIFRFQKEGDVAVFNQDNGETLALSQKTRANCRLFSRKERLLQGVYLEDGMIVSAQGGHVSKLFPRAEILIPGEHNVENYLAAIAAVEGLVSAEVMEAVARTFRGVAHRIELVDTLSGVRYYNDSIASSPSRTIAGLMAFEEELILIAGGYDKKIPFDELGELICRRVKTVILNGDTAEIIAEAIAAAESDKKPKLIRAKDFQDAVRRARRIARGGDVVLMSPACASFDQFENFAARGNCFKEMVQSFAKTEETLAALSRSFGISAFEDAVAAQAEALLAETLPEVWRDGFGNVLACKRCGKEDAKRLLFDAHLDEIGLMVTGAKEGFLRLRAVGGVDPRVLPNLKVTVWGSEALPGLICTLPPHIQSAGETDQSIPIEELWVDVGLSQAEAEQIAPVGTPVSFASDFEALQHGFAAGKALDDRAGFAALLHAARLLQKESLDVDVYFMGSRREETSGAGAKVAAYDLMPDCCVAVDVTHGRTPDGPREESFALGEGPVIGIGPNMTTWVTEGLIQSAESLGLSWQPEVIAGHSGTNAWRMQISREGIPTGLLSIPLRYMHTPYEVLKLSDIEEVGALLAGFARACSQLGGWRA